MPLTIEDIMTTKLVKLTKDATLGDAHRITREQGIRHLPVVEPDTDKLLAIVTQKAMLAKVINTLTLYGGKALTEQENATDIMEVAALDFDAVHKTERLTDVAPFFLDNKHGCLPVVDTEGALIGMVTSSDFVKLSVELLRQREQTE